MLSLVLLCARVVSILFDMILITSLGEDRADLNAFCAWFVCFARVNFCPVSLPLGVRDWLRFVIVDLPGLFLLTFLLFR